MRILISAYSCHPHFGSEANNGWRRAISSAMLGHEVYCLTTSGKTNGSLFDDILRQLNLPNLKFIFVEVPSWVERLYQYRPGVYLHYLIWQRCAYKTAKLLHKQLDFQLIHHITLGSLQMATELWRLKVPLIFGPVGGGQMVPVAFKRYFKSWKYEVLRNWTSKLLMLLRNTKQTIENSTFLLVSNQETYDLALKHRVKNIRIFPDVSLPDSFYPEKNPDRSYDSHPLKLLWIGRLFPRKGLKLVLEALSMVTVPYRLTIIGDGPEGIDLPKCLMENRLEDKVEWKGKVPWHEVRLAYEEHDAFIFCSLRDSIGVQLLEAMAFGLPIITLNINGQKSFVPENAGIKVPATNPADTMASIAIAVEFLYRNPEKNKEFSQNAFQYAQLFKESAIGKKYQELYEQAVRKAPSNKENIVDFSSNNEILLI